MYDMRADFEWFQKNQSKLVKKYNGKTLAIKDKKVLGAYESTADAIENTKLPMGEYLVQLCIPGERAFTVRIYSPRAMV